MPEQAATPEPKKARPRMDLTQGPIARTLLMFSLPVLGTSVLQSLNASINAIWVGRLLGPEALTATTNATLILLLLLGVTFGLGMAATILVGQAVGAKNLTRAKEIVGTTATFFLSLGIIMSIVGFAAAEQLLEWMDTPPEARAMAEDYLRVIFLAVPFMYFFAFMVMAQRGAGDARIPFYFTTLATALDLILNPVLITGFGPFPEMGIAGSGASLLLSQAIGMVAMLIYIYRRKSELRLTRQELHYLKPRPELLRTITLKGLPMGAQMLVISLSGLIMMSMINGYGTETAAAYAVAVQLWTYVQMPAMAIGAAVSSMAAQNVGAGKWDRVERSAHSGVLINVLLTGSLVAILFVIDPLVVGLFLPGQPSAIVAAEHINNIAGWSFIFFGMTFVLFGVVRATGAVIPPLIILIISLFGVRIGFAELLQPAWGQDAIWWSFPVSMMTSAGLALAYYRWGGWRKARMGATASPARHVEDAPATGLGEPPLGAEIAEEGASALAQDAKSTS
ncbi:MAG: MATE family efflux transporter [Alphaproteobacteria bacterium]|nr:MATE family efflux transporter [Alphaproteobacteria bacterium]